jgi:spermidine synthase
MLVDLDPAMTELFSREPLSSLNNSALLNPKVQIRNEDAFVWVRTSTDTGFDVVIIDFPDPNNYGLGKLYTDAFFRLLKQKMSPDGVFSIQSTSPIFSPAAFACVVATVASVGWVATPYHSYVPSFGEWGFVLATTTPPQFRPLPQGLRSFNDQSLDLLLRFPPDLEPKNGEINRLDNQVLVQRYTEDWYASP